MTEIDDVTLDEQIAKAAAKAKERAIAAAINRATKRLIESGALADLEAKVTAAVAEQFGVTDEAVIELAAAAPALQC
ncbi:hypothetical protein ACFVUP_37935, partial [Streptomyces bacillaris]|uniref:hypothetical protein n=1 Tax=Streptomyces bacillaris TaxID=68179 RepID=UPI0036DBD670